MAEHPYADDAEYVWMPLPTWSAVCALRVWAPVSDGLCLLLVDLRHGPTRLCMRFRLRGMVSVWLPRG